MTILSMFFRLPHLYKAAASAMGEDDIYHDSLK